jgi:hypothetical protein
MTGFPMIVVEVEFGSTPALTAGMVRAQLERLVRDDVFRSSKRSVAFLRYVVEQALAGMADQIKERTIGVEVFGRDPSYDTNLDHIVRTAAAELRKRLAAYYVDEKHRSELRMVLIPGSYIPRFTLPHQQDSSLIETAVNGSVERTPESRSGERLHPLPDHLLAERVSSTESATQPNYWRWAFLIVAVSAVAFLAGFKLLHQPNAQDLFWKPVIDTPGPVLLAVGDHPNGPPTVPETDPNGAPPTPVPGSDASQTVPFADTVTVARVVSVLAAREKQVLIRRGRSSSFSDLREGAAVLIGAFNNEWSLRLTRQLRYSLAMDAEKHLVYIRDAKNPSARTWSWGTNQPRELTTGVNSPKVQDYALISRIRDSETGHAVVVVGGLYTYGTQAAGEFLTDPVLMREMEKATRDIGTVRTLQIVLGTTVTDGTPGPPHVLAVSAE